MKYGQRAPHPYLQDFVDCYWFVQQKKGESLILPDGCSDIIFKRYLDGSTEVHYVGLQTKARPVVRAEPCQYFGLRFKAYGAASLLGGQATELINEAILLDELQLSFNFDLKEEYSGLQFLLAFEKSLITTRYKSNVKFQPIVSSATNLLKKGEIFTVAQIAKRLGVSRQYLTRIFKNKVGLSPVQYAQSLSAARATRLLRQDKKPDWAAIALELGFYDQSHFIASFKKITGSTPETYRRLNI